MTKPVDPLHGMSPELRADFERLPRRIQRAYIQFRESRLERRGAHRDQLEAFVAGYYARPGRIVRAA
jgi:hypothetical protein